MDFEYVAKQNVYFFKRDYNLFAMDKWEKFLIELSDRVIEGEKLGREEALAILQTPDEYIALLVYLAQKLKNHFHEPNKVELCSIINAKSGACSEDCKFCAQSKFYKTPINVYPLVPKDEIVEGAHRAVEFGANRHTRGSGKDKGGRGGNKKGRRFAHKCLRVCGHVG
jgi:biotin synthase-like enzyme